MTAGILGVALLKDIIETRRNSDERFAQTLAMYDHDLTVVLNARPNKATKEECEQYALNYLNQLDRMTYLSAQGKISNEILEFFKNGYSYGYVLFRWFQIIGLADEKMKEYWPSLVEWYEDNKVETKPLKEELPFKMTDYAKNILKKMEKENKITTEIYQEKIKKLE